MKAVFASRIHLGMMLGFILLALFYAWSTPIFEASDELWHFGMVQTIAETGQLPVQDPAIETPWQQEGSQPPLYYLIVAALVRSIDRSDFDLVRQPNPHAIVGIPGAVGNKNLVLHDTPHPPLQGTVLAVWVGRLFSITLGVITLWAVYRGAITLFPQRPELALLAVGLTAFNPMFLFISASVNNDNLVTALNSVIIWQTTAMVVQRRFLAWRSLLIAVLITLAALSKLSGLVLVPVVAVAGIWVAIRAGEAGSRAKNVLTRLNWRGLLLLGGAMLVAWGVLAGWWYLRNITLYGELFGTRMMVAVAGPRVEAFTLNTLVEEFQGFRFAYWALFGAVNIMTVRWFYDVMDGITLVALLGLGVWFIRQHRQRLWNTSVAVMMTLFGFLVLIGFASIASWTAQTYASQGRLLFPFIAAISMLLSLGIATVGEYMLRKRAMWMSWVWVPVAVFAVSVPFTTLLPVYASPQPMTQLPADVNQVFARFGDVSLIGYSVADRRYYPGEQVLVTLYWRVDAVSTLDYSLFVHATQADGSVIGKVDSYPGGGRLRTSTWQAGAIYADTYGLPLAAVDEASQMRLQVGWWNFTTGERIQAVDGDGQALESVMLDSGGYAPADFVQTLSAGSPVENMIFGESIRLNAWRLDADELSLEWEVLRTVGGDLTVFAQVLNVDRIVIGQGDAEPVLGTRYWQVGERFVTRHPLRFTDPDGLNAGDIVVGWYDPLTLERLVLPGVPDHALRLGAYPPAS
jgi:hypothetical protein